MRSREEYKTMPSGYCRIGSNKLRHYNNDSLPEDAGYSIKVLLSPQKGLVMLRKREHIETVGSKYRGGRKHGGM